MLRCTGSLTFFGEPPSSALTTASHPGQFASINHAGFRHGEPFLSLTAGLAAVRAAAFRMKDRWKSDRDGPQRFADVDKLEANLLNLVEALDFCLKAHFETSPLETAPNFLTTARDVEGDLVIAADMTDAYCDEAFGESSSGDWTQPLAEMMTDIAGKTSNAYFKLQQLFGRLCPAMRTEEDLDDLGGLDPRGSVRIAMFLGYAAPTIDSDEDRECEEMLEILDLCARLSISITIAGRAVALSVADLGFQCACKLYLEDVSDEKRRGEPFLTTAVRISLASLQKKRDQTGEREKYSVSEMYTSFCVFSKQQVACKYTMADMWGMDQVSTTSLFFELASLSLGKMSMVPVSPTGIPFGTGEDGILIHDMLLEYCRDVTEQSGAAKTWHTRLRGGFEDYLGRVP